MKPSPTTTPAEVLTYDEAQGYVLNKFKSFDERDAAMEVLHRALHESMSACPDDTPSWTVEELDDMFAAECEQRDIPDGGSLASVIQ